MWNRTALNDTQSVNAFYATLCDKVYDVSVIPAFIRKYAWTAYAANLAFGGNGLEKTMNNFIVSRCS